MRSAFFLLAVAVAACGDGSSAPSADPPCTSCDVSYEPDDRNGPVNSSQHYEEDIASPPPAPLVYPPCSEGMTNVCEIAHEVEIRTLRSYATAADQRPQRLVADETSLYWMMTSAFEYGFHLRQVSKLASGATSIPERTNGSYFSSDLALSGSSLFWTDADGVQRAPLAGGSAERFLSAQFLGNLSADSSRLYVGGANASVVTVPIAGGNATPFVPDNGCILPVIEGDSVFCHAYRNDVIRRYPKDGSAPNVVVTGMSNVFAVSASTLYAVREGGKAPDQVISVPVEGGAPSLVSYGTGGDFYLEMFVRGDSIFALRSSGDIDRIRLDGAPTTTLSTWPLPATHFAVDASGVYWVGTRSYCLLEHRSTSTTAYGSTTESSCKDGRNELFVLRAGASF